MSTTTILSIAVDSLRQEQRFISELVNCKLQDLLEGSLDTFKTKFNTPLKNIEDDISKIAADLLEHSEHSEEEAWSKYINLRTRDFPVLSSEVLAVIGGLFLKKHQLDALGSTDPKVPVLTASGLAQRLISYLVSKTTWEWGSLLIVGEERLGSAEAQVIRLRFPGCDIWNLPFIAHEYGYLVARSEAYSREFARFRYDMTGKVDPRRHEFGSPPQNKAAFLPEIATIWERHHSISNEAHRDAYHRAIQHRLTALEDDQESFLCHLFADTFATCWLGPAYLYALLVLRFLPDESHQPWATSMPPFKTRFVFALATLRWMHEELAPQFGEAKPFTRELEPPDAATANPQAAGTGAPFPSLPALWAEVQKAVGQSETSSEVPPAYAEWWAEIKQRVRKDAIRTTLEHCRLAQNSLEPFLMGAPRANRPEKPPEPVAVLNAAWAARIQQPASARETIEGRALEMLRQEPERQAATQSTTARASAQPPPVLQIDRDMTVREPDKSGLIDVVRQGLANAPSAVRDRFAWMVRDDKFKLIGDLEPYLPLEAYNAFRKLEELSAHSASPTRVAGQTLDGAGIFTT